MMPSDPIRDALKVLEDVPIGYVGDTVVRHRSTTEADVAAWLRRVEDVKVRLRRHVLGDG